MNQVPCLFWQRFEETLDVLKSAVTDAEATDADIWLAVERIGDAGVQLYERC